MHLPPPAREPHIDVVSSTLVGREKELLALASTLVRAPAVVVVEGEAGIGKSRLMSELLRREEVAGRRHLVGRCHQVHEPFPLGSVVEAIRGLGGDLGGLGLDPVAGALRPLVPELAPSLPPAPEPLDDRAAERHRVFRGLADVLRAAGPTVLVLEDLHWGDRQTIDFLTYLLASPPARLSTVVTLRAEEAASALVAMTARLSSDAAGHHMVLEPLSRADCGALAAAILGVETVSSEFADFLFEHTSGLPFAVEEVVALARAKGQLVYRDGTWTRRELEYLDVPRRIRDSTLERVAQLSQSARRLAEAASVLQSPTAVPVLFAVAGDSGAVEAVEEATGSGVLAERDESVGFRHLLAAQAVYGSLSAARRQHLHGLAATALEDAAAASLGQIAHHLKRAGRPRAWAETAERAADQAIAAGNEDEAVRLLTDVVDNAALPAERRAAVAVKLGWAALDTLHLRKIIGLLDGVLDEDPPGPLRGQLRFLLAMVLTAVGVDPSRQRRLFHEAIGDLEDRPDVRAWALVALGIIHVPGLSLAEQAASMNRALDLVDQIDDRLLEVFILGKAGALLMETGDPSWRDVADRMQRITGGTPRQRREANAHFTMGMSACYTGHLRTAESLLTSSLNAPAAQQNRRIDVMIRCALVLLRYFRGDWFGLRDDVDDLMGKVADYVPNRVGVELIAGHLDLAHGDIDAACDRLRQVSELAADIGAYDDLAIAVGAWSRACLARGDVPAALQCVRLLVDTLDKKALWPPVGWALPAAVETWVTAGGHTEAREFTDRFRRETDDRDVPLADAALACARGFLATSTTESVAAFRAAAQLYAALSIPYEAARAHEMAGSRLLLGSGAHHDGAALLKAAFTAYRTLGATGDSARVLSLARRHGVKLPRLHRGGQRSYGITLSPREQQVAELAATGRTNNEIARRLFISTNTVSKHLGAAMRKLRANSRTELAHLLVTQSKNGTVW